ncbi:unnamed protein product, partial [Rotaria sp. Silwood2]
MSASNRAENAQTFCFPDLSVLDKSASFHSSHEGKVWTRLLINLCWWLHDMYEENGADPNSKYAYIDDKLAQCRSLFPAESVLIFSDVSVLPQEQHPFLICRQDAQKTVILVFRATVSSKSLNDVFTDISFHANREAYEGSRHAGFSKRAKSGPLIAVISWLLQGWKIIITGHSLGGAVSQLFTCAVIKSLAEMGKTSNDVILRCVTFGVPQCADNDFWSSYVNWYGVFDTYIYENDAIFRLATFGSKKANKIVKSFCNCYAKIGRKLIAYFIGEPLQTILDAGGQIVDMISDAVIPTYAVLGRHHFIVKNQTASLEIKTIGESEDEKNIMLKYLRDGDNWYTYFLKRQLIPSEPFKFTYRAFIDHGCYPFSINQLFNESANQRLSHLKEPKLTVQRSLLDIERSKSIFNVSATVLYPNEINTSDSYIYLRGFLVDFIRFVTLPPELAEPNQSPDKIPITISEKSDGRAVLYYKSELSSEFITENSTIVIHVTTFFGSCDVSVARLSNSGSQIARETLQQDPISIILSAYQELVLDASSVQEHNNSPLSQYFSQVFDAFKLIGNDELDELLARYITELQTSNYLDNATKYLESIQLPQARDSKKEYFRNELKLLKKTSDDANNVSDETRQKAKEIYNRLSNTLNSVDGPQLTPLYLEYDKLRQHLHDLHTHQDRDIDAIKEAMKITMAPLFFINVKLNSLVGAFQKGTLQYAAESALAIGG